MEGEGLKQLADIQTHTFDQNILLANLGHSGISGELQTIEAVGVGNGPLLLS